MILKPVESSNSTSILPVNGRFLVEQILSHSFSTWLRKKNIWNIYIFHTYMSLFKIKICASFMGYFIIAILYLAVWKYIFKDLHNTNAIKSNIWNISQQVVWPMLCQINKECNAFIKLTIAINRRKQKCLN